MGLLFKHLLLNSQDDEFVYLLRDEFTDALAAGSVNGTDAAPGPGTRVVVDSDSRMSVGSGVLNLAPASPAAWGDPGVWYDAITRALGQIFIFRISPTQTNKTIALGLDANTSGLPGASYFAFGATGAIIVRAAVSVAAYTATPYILAVVLRAAGAFYFVKGGAFTNWTLLFVDLVDSTATLYPVIETNSATFTADYFRHPENTYIPVPTVSDGFGSAAVGGIYYSDGAGHVEANGGSGVAWADTVGTWANAGGLANPDTLDGGLGLRTITAKADGLIQFTPSTVAGGNTGLVLRYVDANNYVYIYHDGTNITLRKVVGGVDSQVLAPTLATAPNGSRPLMVWMKGTKFRIYWNGAAVGSEQTIADAALQDSAVVGLYTTDAGNNSNDFFIFPAGSGNEHSELDQYNSNTFTGIYPVGDSKTIGANDTAPGKGWPQYLCNDAMDEKGTYFVETPDRYGVDGGSTDTLAGGIDAELATVPDYIQPEYIFVGLGGNDVTAMPAENDWKTDYAYILDALHVKFPDAIIYNTYCWRKTYDSECDTLAGYLAAVLADGRSAWAKAGDDERVWLEGGDDGDTYSDDGVHPNHAGYLVGAAAKLAVMGI